MKLNIPQILASAANVINVLSGAGVAIPATVVNTAAKALPIISAVQNVVANPSNVAQDVADLAAIAATIAPTGVAAADTEIQTILGEVSKYTQDLANLEAGQAVVVASSSISLNGKVQKLTLAIFVEGGAAAQSLGL